MANVNKDENSEKTLSAGKQNKVLRPLVQQHKICWEVLPEQISVKDEAPLKVGFDLMLSGTPAVGEYFLPQVLRSAGRFTCFK